MSARPSLLTRPAGLPLTLVCAHSKKYRDHEHKGTWTNRLVHVRFLDICPTWHAHLATDDRALDDGEGSDAEVKEEDDDTRMSAPASLPHSSLWSNPALVRRRVVRAVRTAYASGEDYLLHQDIAPKIVSLRVSCCLAHDRGSFRRTLGTDRLPATRAEEAKHDYHRHG